MDNSKKIAKNTIFLYIRMVFVLIIGLYTTRVVLNVLGASDYGIFNVVCGFVTLFGFLNTSMTNAIQRFYNYEIGKNGERELVNVYNSALFVQVVLAILIVIFIESFGLWYLNNKLVIPDYRLCAANILFQFAVVQLFFTVISVPYSAIIVANEKMDYYALVSILDVFIKLIIVIIIPYVDTDKLLIYGLLLTLVGVINFSLYVIYAKIHFSYITIKRIRDYSILKSMLSFSGWNVFGTLAYMLKNQGLAIVLNLIFGTLINAAYGISNQVMSAIKQFSLNIILAFKPQLIQSYASGDYDKTRHLMYSMTKITYIMLFAISLPFLIEIETILGLWLKDVPDYTPTLTRLAIISMLVSNFNTPLVQVVHAVGKQKVFQIITSIIIFGIVPASYFILNIDPAPANIYWVTIFFVVVNQFACLLALKKVFYFSIKEYFFSSISPCIVVTITSSILPLLIGSFIEFTLIVRLFIVAVTSIISVFFCSYFVAIGTEERNEISVFLKNKLKFIIK